MKNQAKLVFCIAKEEVNLKYFRNGMNLIQICEEKYIYFSIYLIIYLLSFLAFKGIAKLMVLPFRDPVNVIYRMFANTIWYKMFRQKDLTTAFLGLLCYVLTIYLVPIVTMKTIYELDLRKKGKKVLSLMRPPEYPFNNLLIYKVILIW